METPGGFALLEARSFRILPLGRVNRILTRLLMRKAPKELLGYLMTSGLYLFYLIFSDKKLNASDEKSVKQKIAWKRTQVLI